MLHQDKLLRETGFVSLRGSTPGPGFREGSMLPLSHLGGVAGLALQNSSVLPGLVSTSTRHLVKVADVVQKANSMQHGHRCACFDGSMEAYGGESAMSRKGE